MKNPVQIIFADDKAKFRRTLLNKLSGYGIECMAEASNGKELLKLLSSKIPDVVVLDLGMPVMDGNEAMKQIMNLYPETKVIILSFHNEALLVEDYIKRGAKAYLSKHEVAADPEILAKAIVQVKEGEIFISGDMKDEIKSRKNYLSYTKRQKEIILLLCEGKTNKEIASSIGILERSVEKQRQKIYEKTNSEKAVDFFRYAFAQGLQFLGKENYKKRLLKNIPLNK